MNGSVWTEEEIEILRRDTESGVNRRDTATKLNRTWFATQSKAEQLGFFWYTKPLTRDELEALRSRWEQKLPGMRAAIREAVLQSA